MGGMRWPVNVPDAPKLEAPKPAFWTLPNPLDAACDELFAEDIELLLLLEPNTLVLNAGVLDGDSDI